MHVRVITPTEILYDAAAGKVNATAANGSFTMLPKHIDFVTALTPGILVLTTKAGDEQFLALDEGVLVKRGDDVRVAAFRGVRGATLEELQRVVAEEFRQLDEHERMARTAISRLEAGFIRRMIDMG